MHFGFEACSSHLIRSLIYARFRHVHAADVAAAVEVLLVSDTLFRARNLVKFNFWSFSEYNVYFSIENLFEERVVLQVLCLELTFQGRNWTNFNLWWNMCDPSFWHV